MLYIHIHIAYYIIIDTYTYIHTYILHMLHITYILLHMPCCCHAIYAITLYIHMMLYYYVILLLLQYYAILYIKDTYIHMTYYGATCHTYSATCRYMLQDTSCHELRLHTELHKKIL